MRQQRLEGQGGVTQPHVPVVPVADPAEVLGQRRGRGRRDPSGVVVGECPQHQQGPHHLGPVDAAVLDPVGPRLPPVPGPAQGPGHVQRFRNRPEGREPGQREVDALPRGHPDGRRVPVPVRMQPEATQHECVRAGHRDQFRRVVGAGLPDPGHRPGVVEPDPQVDVELDGPGHADHAADEVGAIDVRVRIGAGRHGVVHLGDPGGGHPAGDQDEAVPVVAPGRPGVVRARPQPPAAVIGAAEQRGEHRRRVESRQAEPVDPARARHQRRGAAVAEQRVVLDRRDHRFDPGTVAPDLPCAGCYGDAQRRVSVAGSVRHGGVGYEGARR